jgi:RimJ/RimL family protein N-acetyltransferase
MDILLREYTEQDIIIQDRYFDTATDEYLYNLGVDPSKIRNQPPTDVERIRKLLATPIKERTAQNYVVERQGTVIGIAVIKKIKYGEHADLHAHIFDIGDRHRGIATRVFFEVLKKAFEVFELKILVCEPTSTNLPPNAFLQKMGVPMIRSYPTAAEGILRARIANRYEITREYFESLKQRMAISD